MFQAGTIKVLMADDEKEILAIMAQKVMEEGYDVVTAHDGDETWEKIQLESPDVIVLDLTMPKRSGLDVLRELRMSPPSSKWQPVIIVSGQGEMEDIQKGFSMEADHYITKPCSVSDILQSIRLMVNLIPQRRIDSDDKKTAG